MGIKLHIVSFNVPYPPDYGGIIDVFYRIKALSSLGVEIHLHCFTYGRQPADELNRLCASVTYYRRHTGFISALSKKPYIAQSRQCAELVENLRHDDAPILLEGLHCCSVLEALGDRRILVRAHNVEHEYYARLAAAEKNLFRRLYLAEESRRLRNYETVLTHAHAVLAVTKADADHFKAIGCRNVVLMPSSHPNDIIVSQPCDSPCANTAYALYHADLSVAENIDTVDYLVKNLFPQSQINFVVAGRNPSKRMVDMLAPFGNVKLIANPNDETMRRLIREAQVQLLLTGSPTGLKLKLLNSLYAGRHCLVNHNMVAGTELGRLCTVADNADMQRDALTQLMQTPFTESDIQHRRTLLGTLYSNQSNANILLAQI